jgi:CMP-N-acetylneuraminic acid synthetase
LEAVETKERRRYEYLLLLDPTSPGREPKDISEALSELEASPNADGILGVSQPDFNPIWHCVVEKDGWMTDLFEEGPGYDHRQDVPPVYRIHGSLYIWRTEFVRAHGNAWRTTGKHLIYETPEFRSLSFDTFEEFERANTLVESGFINLPWMIKSHS